jgi:hypothetical protein
MANAGGTTDLGKVSLFYSNLEPATPGDIPVPESTSAILFADSTNSGVPAYRLSNGIYYSLEQVATPGPSRVEVNTPTYTLTGLDRIVAVLYTQTGSPTLTLPLASSVSSSSSPAFVNIVDEGGNASENAITIVPSGGDRISGSTSVTLHVSHSALSLYANGANWYIF